MTAENHIHIYIYMLYIYIYIMKEPCYYAMLIYICYELYIVTYIYILLLQKEPILRNHIYIYIYIYIYYIYIYTYEKNPYIIYI